MQIPDGYQLAGLLIALPEAPASPASSPSYRCVDVPDGDGLVVEHAGQTYPIRLWGLDAPEWNQPFGSDAKTWLANRCMASDVHLATVVQDRFKRYVAHVLDSRYRSVCYDIVQAGLAWHYATFAPDAHVLEALQADAKRARRGLWSAPHPVPPWTWRDSH